MQDRITHYNNTFAAIYCRISSDKTGAGLGVERQEADCRELAERLGLEVKYVLVDNDTSAYSGKKRPGYEELLRLIDAGDIHTVIAWHTDRLHRRLRDLLDYLDAVEKSGVKTITVKAGDIDLSTSQGIMLAQVSGAIAEGYVRTNTEKLQRAKLQAAVNGEFRGGQRPFGFEPQRKGIRESEAKILREMAARITDGESYRTVAIDLNRRGITTQHGKKWGSINVRNVLVRPINAGLDEHKGIIRKAKTPGILTEDEWVALQAAILLSRTRSGHPGRFRKHLLNGLLFCGLCGAKLMHKSKQKRDGSYRAVAACGRTDSQTGEQVGCGGVSRQVGPIIDLVADAVIYRLDSPALAKRLQQRKAGQPELAKLLAHQSALNGRIAKLSNDHYVRGLINDAEFERLKLETDAELQETERQITKSTRSVVLPTVSIAGDIRQAWESSSLEWKRDLLFQIIKRIDVMPKPKVKGYSPPRYKEQWRFDPELVEIKWRI